jgi:dipeptidyl aminopeptidase/acylaminoacyl peptidase
MMSRNTGAADYASPSGETWRTCRVPGRAAAEPSSGSIGRARQNRSRCPRRRTCTRGSHPTAGPWPWRSRGPTTISTSTTSRRTVLSKVTTDGLSHDPVWSPDGDRLAFRSWLAGGMTLWWMPADRSGAPNGSIPAGRGRARSRSLPTGSFSRSIRRTRRRVTMPGCSPRGKSGRPSRSRRPVRRGVDEVLARRPLGRVLVGRIWQARGVRPGVPRARAEASDLQRRRQRSRVASLRAASCTTAPGKDDGGVGGRRLRNSGPRPRGSSGRALLPGTGASCGMPGVSSSNYDVTADGQRFLMVRDEDDSTFATKIVVVLNWVEQLKAIERARTQTASARRN